jgi:hypothetical protein
MLRQTATFTTTYEIIAEKHNNGFEKHAEPVGAGARWPGNFSE